MKEKILAKKKWIIGIVVVIAVLAAAFCYGGNAPGTKGEAEGDLDKPLEQLVLAANAKVQANADADSENADEQEAAVEEEKTETADNGMVIDPKTGKDKYNTDPVPAGKPTPVEPENTTVSSKTHTCTISVSCATILDNMSYLKENKKELVPSDGWILKETKVTFNEGQSVYDVLQSVLKEHGIHMEASFTPMYNSAYVEGINNLYEFDCGELSGWMYSVNGWFPNYGCSRYQVQAGDVIKWVYTCDLGYDVGGGYMGE